MIIVDDKVWNEIEEKIGLYTPISLKIGEDKITIEQKISKEKIIYTIYINGWMKGNETEENQHKYWNEKIKRLGKTDIAYFKYRIKYAETKEEKEEYKKKLEGNKAFGYWVMFFDSFRSLKSAYKKRHKEIYWIEN